MPDSPPPFPLPTKAIPTTKSNKFTTDLTPCHQQKLSSNHDAKHKHTIIVLHHRYRSSDRKPSGATNRRRNTTNWQNTTTWDLVQIAERRRLYNARLVQIVTAAAPLRAWSRTSRHRPVAKLFRSLQRLCLHTQRSCCHAYHVVSCGASVVVQQRRAASSKNGGNGYRICK